MSFKTLTPLRCFEPPALVEWLIFWCSGALIVALFAIPSPWCWPLLLCIVPLIHGSHEVLHENVGRSSAHAAATRFHQDAAETFGFALQGINIDILRPAHMHHHQTGRHQEGFVPDLRWSTRHLYGLARYYANLLFLPALCFQLAGFARLFLSPHRLPFVFPEIMPPCITRRYICHQAAVVSFVIYVIAVGGVVRALVYEIVLCVVWSVQQNVAHHGLKGPTSAIDRVCAKTYLLPWPLNWLTFGSTSHFLHHADMRVPGRELYREDHIRAAEARHGITIQRHYGTWHYIRDLATQFRGPLQEADLTTEWIASIKARSGEPQTSGVPKSGAGWVLKED